MSEGYEEGAEDFRTPWDWSPSSTPLRAAMSAFSGFDGLRSGSELSLAGTAAQKEQEAEKVKKLFRIKAWAFIHQMARALKV